VLRPASRLWTTGTAALVFGAALSFAALAQESAPPEQAPSETPAPADAAEVVAPPPFLTLNQDRLFRESAWGRDAMSRAEADTAALAAENRRIEEALEKEERDLTERRATMAAGDFARLASEFDVKVEEIRAAQDAKSRAITRRLDEDRSQFFQAVRPVLEGLLAETGAVAILADSAIVMSLKSLDITEAAIARVDAVLVPAAPAQGGGAAPQSGPVAPGP
jgi:Skp family chaperone for outer membrane proteins